MAAEEFKVDDIYCYRYKNESARYALIICHGIGAWGGLYDPFCVPFSERGVDIWSVDLPGFGDSGEPGVFSGQGHYDAVARIAREIKTHHDIPVFVLGSSLGSHTASGAWNIDEISGVVLTAGAFVAGGLAASGVGALFGNPQLEAVFASNMGPHIKLDVDSMVDWEQNYGDKEYANTIVNHPKHTAYISLKSLTDMMSWQPPKSITENTKPLLLAIAARDQLAPLDIAKAEFENIGGSDKTLKVFDTDKHQIMWARAEEYSETLDEWCSSKI